MYVCVDICVLCVCVSKSICIISARPQEAPAPKDVKSFTSLPSQSIQNPVTSLHILLLFQSTQILVPPGLGQQPPH